MIIPFNTDNWLSIVIQILSGLKTKYCKYDSTEIMCFTTLWLVFKLAHYSGMNKEMIGIQQSLTISAPVTYRCHVASLINSLWPSDAIVAIVA